MEIADALSLDAAWLHGDGPPEHTTAVARAVDTVIEVVTVDRARTTDLDEHAADIVTIDAPTPGAGISPSTGVSSVTW